MPTPLKIALSITAAAILALTWLATPATPRDASRFRLRDQDPFYALARSRTATRLVTTLLTAAFIAAIWLAT